MLMAFELGISKDVVDEKNQIAQKDAMQTSALSVLIVTLVAIF
jgi:hypothetical protein